MSAGRSKVSLNPSRPLRAFPREGTIIDESPALTAVLQAQPGRIVASGAGGGVRTRWSQAVGQANLWRGWLRAGQDSPLQMAGARSPLDRFRLRAIAVDRGAIIR